MQNLYTLLNEEELGRLDHFICERIDENADIEGRDEGVLDISELDGFLTAIVSCPVMTLPSTWLPAMWGDFEPIWENEKEMEVIFSLMLRHMNGIASTLVEQSQNFEPLFIEREVKGKIYTIVDEWCEGYMRGVALEAEQWDTNTLEMKILLSPIMAFAGEQARQTYEKFHSTELENIQKAIAPNVQEIHAYWLARRQDDAPASSPVRRSEPRIGRNDPCPCGSGKKFKKCCLH